MNDRQIEDLDDERTSFKQKKQNIKIFKKKKLVIMK